MQRPVLTEEALRLSVGQSVGTSDWHRVDQVMIDAFADLTGDHQFIHVDPVRAAAGPLGTTVAHGFLTLSLLGRMTDEALPPLAKVRYSVNYGFDRVRFVAPVPVDSDLRAVLRLMAMDDATPGQVRLMWEVTVEIKGLDRPAVVATWIHLHFMKGILPDD
ncbi:MaoC family dehydratase [Loktanella sp. DJP18]|uniref:MaoC family dehydratase n=1 Tax=Loktanella sp. DJP18 TaxID=3409788 RepID=UPI003BB80400